MSKTPKVVALKTEAQTTDDILTNLKREICDKLRDVAHLMDLAAIYDAEVTFNISKTSGGSFDVNNFVLTRRY